MKCENCGKNEVTFVYRSNINGRVEEKHLCSACAEKLGYTQRINAGGRRMMQDFFGNGLFGSGFFDDFFSPMPSLFGRMNRMLEDPFDDFFAEMPALTASPAQQQEARERESQWEKKAEDHNGKIFAAERKERELQDELSGRQEEQQEERAQLQEQQEVLQWEGHPDAVSMLEEGRLSDMPEITKRLGEYEKSL